MNAISISCSTGYCAVVLFISSVIPTNSSCAQDVVSFNMEVVEVDSAQVGNCRKLLGSCGSNNLKIDKYKNGFTTKVVNVSKGCIIEFPNFDIILEEKQLLRINHKTIVLKLKTNPISYPCEANHWKSMDFRLLLDNGEVSKSTSYYFSNNSALGCTSNDPEMRDNWTVLRYKDACDYLGVTTTTASFRWTQLAKNFYSGRQVSLNWSEK